MVGGRGFEGSRVRAQSTTYRCLLLELDSLRDVLYLLIFFVQSKQIKLSSPQAAWLSIIFVGKAIVLHLLDGPELRTHYWENRKERKKPSTQWDLNPCPLCYEACAQPLCYNHCPRNVLYNVLMIFDFRWCFCPEEGSCSCTTWPAPRSAPTLATRSPFSTSTATATTTSSSARRCTPTWPSPARSMRPEESTSSIKTTR